MDHYEESGNLFVPEKEKLELDRILYEDSIGLLIDL